MIQTKEELFIAELGGNPQQEIELSYGAKIKIKDLLSKYLKAINYSQCCTKLKDNRTQNFWGWVRDNKMQLKDDGVVYKQNTYLISDLYRKWKREIEPNL